MWSQEEINGDRYYFVETFVAPESFNAKAPRLWGTAKVSGLANLASFLLDWD